MTEQLAFPPAVVLALWLNAVRGGFVSATDAANAIETVTEQVDLLLDLDGDQASKVSWIELVSTALASSQPAAVALPVDGDPAGVSVEVLKKIDRTAGVVALNKERLLVRKLEGFWSLLEAPNTVIHYDLSQTRRLLTENIEEAARKLATGDLVGDQDMIRNALDEFRSLHLPPSLSKRSAESIELAARIAIVAEGALKHSTAIYSPSIDKMRIKTLEQLARTSRFVLQSAITE